MGDLMFVYGSLKQKGSHARQMAGAVYLRTDTLLGFELIRYEDGYPAVRAQPGGKAPGELYLVSRRKLVELDRFEEAPRLYERRRGLLESGVQAWVYALPKTRESDPFESLSF